MQFRICILLASTSVGALLQAEVFAASSATWNVSLSTSGEDVFWTSPTAIDPGFPEYDWSYEITKVTANVFILGDQDLLDVLETTSGSGTSLALPLVVVDDTLSEPTTNSSADIRIEIDADGFGRASGTNITLGSFGLFQIRRVDFEATISVIGIPTGDYNRNGEVDEADYANWRQDFGSTTELAADGNGDQVVNAADYTTWRDNLGAGMGAVDSQSVPEPAACWLSLAGLAAAARRHSRHPSK